jgi:putative two-component system response regulator
MTLHLRRHSREGRLFGRGIAHFEMAAYSKALALASGLNPEYCKKIELAAPMHDMGKIGIPDSILRKPGKLDADEWVVMKTHSKIGHDILPKSHSPIFRIAAEIALRHHERWDGSGYPDGLAGEVIPISARIVALADVFDALSMKRPYKDAWPIAQVVESIQACSGSHFDPKLVAIFLTILPQLIEIQNHWDKQTASR